MNHNEKAIEVVVSLLKKHNIHHIVISPGGTNIAFVKAVQDDSFFKCYSIVDERSAMYFAIGLYLQTGETIATSCTSAQATRNYIPGLTEAYYKRVPILAITMEKHPRFIGQEYMQAPDQASLPEDSVKKSFVMPFITDINDEYQGIRVANDAMLELNHNGKGPVQLVIPWLDFEISSHNLKIRDIERFTDGSSVRKRLVGKRIMIVVGEHRPFKDSELKAINSFVDNYNCAVYTNHLSNYHGDYSFDGNFLMSTVSLDVFATNYAPNILISIGGQTGDYPFYLLFSKPELSSTDHWRVAEDGKVVDTYDKLTAVFQCPEEAFFKTAVGESNNSSDHSYFASLKEEDSRINRNLELPFSNAYIAQQISQRIPQSSIIQFAILNSLRVWNLFTLDDSVSCFCNVGAFGIDGGMSTLIGQSFATDKLCFMITGDLAFYYDMNSLGIRGIKNNVRVLIINNNGGIEFKLGGSNPDTDRFIAAANHFKNAKGWAETCGFRYLAAKNKKEFSSVSNEFLKESDQPIVLETFVNDNDEAAAYQKLIKENRQLSLNDYFKKGIKKLIR